MNQLLALFSCILLSLPFQTVAQDWEYEPPSYQKIEKSISKKKSAYYYPSLMSRYMAGDTTMGLEEKRHLYYGYSFHEDYSPYGSPAYSDSLQSIFQGSREEVDNQLMLRYCDSILAEDPFHMNALNYSLYAADEIGDTLKFNLRLFQSQCVFEALISSGHGTSKADAFYVITTSDEYALLNYLGFEFGGQQSLIEHYDYLNVAENDAGIEGLYFDITPCLDNLSGMFKD